jgi:hypothetical protein
MKRLFWVIIISCVALISNVSADPVQWTIESGGNGHWYEVIQGDYTWHDSLEDASSRSWMEFTGYLATITSAEEGSWVWLLLSPDMCWLGGFQPSGSVEPAGGWSWITGEPWNYENWAVGEPNNYHGGVENYLVYHNNADGTWNDRTDYDTQPLGYLVEYGVEAVGSERHSWGSVKSLYR